jgi:hypothetical protein
LGRHIARFEDQSELTTNLRFSLQACGNLRESSSVNLFDKNFGLVRPCGKTGENDESKFAKISAIAKLKRTAKFDALIDSFNEDVLPTFIDALVESYDRIPKLDDAQMSGLIDLVSQVATISKSAVDLVEWRPDYTNSVRYLNQIVLTELTKGREQDINWELVKAATTARLDIFPLSPGDAGVNPIVVSIKDPLYKLLYGPNPRGAAYWIMTAASTIRLETYGGVRARNFDIYPLSVKSLDVVPRQILLESKDDQTLIKRAITHLTHNFERIM